MRHQRLATLLDAVESGEIGASEALSRLEWPPPDQPSFANLDRFRELRTGQPEAVYSPGKTVEQLLEICRSLAASGDGFLATRTSTEQLGALVGEFDDLEVSEPGRIAWLPGAEASEGTGARIAVVTGGTADLPVAEEARVTSRALGGFPELYVDVGVAGIHRVLRIRERLQEAIAVIAVAGMDGALASVIGGLVRVPVIAVPTSTGYGVAADGIAPLMTMMASCAPGILVTNIDNGYGAACAAARIEATASRRTL